MRIRPVVAVLPFGETFVQAFDDGEKLLTLCVGPLAFLGQLSFAGLAFLAFLCQLSFEGFALLRKTAVRGLREPCVLW